MDETEREYMIVWVDETGWDRETGGEIIGGHSGHIGRERSQEFGW